MHNPLLQAILSVTGLVLFLLVPLPASAQIFSSEEAGGDSTRSRWSFSVEPLLGLTGSFQDSIGTPSSPTDTTDTTDLIDPIIGLLTRLVPDRAILSYGLSAGVHYLLSREVTAGVTIGYGVRGTGTMTILTPEVLYNEIAVRYLTLGTRITLSGGSRIFGSLGLQYGIPLFATAISWSSVDADYNLLDSDEFTIPSAILIDLRLLYSFLKLRNHVLSAGIIWDATFTKLATPRRSPNEIKGRADHTTSLQLGVNWSFGL